MEIIKSRDNPQVKLLAGLLTSKKERDRTGLFALEGLRLCTDALESGIAPEIFFLTPEAADRYPGARTLIQGAKKVVWLDPELARRIGETTTPQGIFGVCKKLDIQKSAVKIRDGGCYLLLGSLQDPGNIGSIFRTAEAVGLDGIYLSGDCPDLYSPKVLRASMGGVFRMAASAQGDLTDTIDRLQSRGIPVYAAALTKDATPVTEVNFSTGGAVLLGNEGNGLPPELIGRCTGSAIIPMSGRAESLGVAAAAAIIMWEMQRGRGEKNRRG